MASVISSTTTESWRWRLSRPGGRGALRAAPTCSFRFPCPLVFSSFCPSRPLHHSNGAIMKSYFPRRQSVLTLLIVLVIAGTPACENRTQAPGNGVRLVVEIVIDQFPFEYLVRFQSQFGEGGFKRLMNDGAVFTNANYIHTPTYTACGHATFMTGATPAMNGIVGNEWYDRETGKEVTSVSDDQTKLLDGK